MKQYGQTINLKDDPATIAKYIEHHRSVWPEVERGLKAIGIRRMLIWIRDRQLFMFMETADEFDPARDFARYERSDPTDPGMAAVDGLDAGTGRRRASRRMVGRDGAGLLAVADGAVGDVSSNESPGRCRAPSAGFSVAVTRRLHARHSDVAHHMF